jgi:CheY-like chemotaxis protein
MDARRPLEVESVGVGSCEAEVLTSGSCDWLVVTALSLLTSMEEFDIVLVCVGKPTSNGLSALRGLAALSEGADPC